MMEVSDVKFSTVYKSKSKYVSDHILPYLSISVKLSEFFKNDNIYLDELIEKAHRQHYKKICKHNIDWAHIAYYDGDKSYAYFINTSSIKKFRNIATAEKRISRHAMGVNIDILNYNNLLTFDVYSKSCLCADVKIN